MRKFFIAVAVAVSLGGIVAGMFFAGLEPGDSLWPLSWVVWAPVGGLILWSRPRNGVGITQLVIGLAWGLSFVCLALSVNVSEPTVQIWLGWLGTVLGVLPWLGIVWLMVIFPSGSLETRFERVVAALVILFGVWASVGFTFSTSPLDESGQSSPFANPSLDWLTQWIVGDSGFMVVPVLVVLAIGALIARWRRSDGIQRRQYQWLFFGTSLFGLILVLGQVSEAGSSWELLWLVAGAAIPVTIGIAVFRYRLYEIDRLISRTFAYALVVALLGAVFALGVVVVPNLVIGATTPPPLVVAASTLAVAALFNPLRVRVLRWVDRRFNRSRYDAERVIEGFVGSLRDRTDGEEVVAGWLGVVTETMQPTSVGVWLKS